MLPCLATKSSEILNNIFSAGIKTPSGLTIYNRSTTHHTLKRSLFKEFKRIPELLMSKRLWFIVIKYINKKMFLNLRRN